jgi:cytochrome c biogenesis protein CcmG, thiol:disulfide interchange protein DsbE
LKNLGYQIFSNNGDSSLLWLVGILTAVILLGACAKPVANNEPATSSGPPSTTYPMPPLSSSAEMGWVESDNRRVSLTDYRGKVLVLDFYATWCEPCRQSIPRLKELQAQYGPAGVQVVGLNVGGPDDRIKVTEFARELDIQYPLGFPDKALSDFFLSDDQTIPQTFIFGRGGELAKRFIGYDKGSGDEMETTIKAELERSDR